MPMTRISFSDAMSANVYGVKPKSIRQRRVLPPSMLGDKSVYRLRCQAGRGFPVDMPSRVSGTIPAYVLDMMSTLRYEKKGFSDVFCG